MKERMKKRRNGGKKSEIVHFYTNMHKMNSMPTISPNYTPLEMVFFQKVLRLVIVLSFLERTFSD